MYYRVINQKKKIATMLADGLGYLLWSPVNLFKRKRNSSKIKEILVIRTAYIGDVVMTLPILKPLKELYPDAKITFLTSSGAKPLLAGNPYLDRVLAYDAFWFYPRERKKAVREYREFVKELKKKKYDLVIEARADIRDILLLAYRCRTGSLVSYRVGGGGFLLTETVPFERVRHRVEFHLDIVRYLGASDIDRVEWGISLTDEEKSAVRELLPARRKSTGLLVGIHPGGRKQLKCWPKERFAELADTLAGEEGVIIFTGTSQESGLIDDIMNLMTCGAVNLAGRSGLKVLAGLIGEFDLFICNDSSPLHLASAMGTPTVAIFGPSKSQETGPYGNRHRVVEKDFPCRFSCDEDVCTYATYNECMDQIAVKDVLNAISDLRQEIKQTFHDGPHVTPS